MTEMWLLTGVKLLRDREAVQDSQGFKTEKFFKARKLEEVTAIIQNSAWPRKVAKLIGY